MRTMLLAIALLSVFIAPVYAESAREMCTAEVRDAGIEDQEEINLYIQECIAQITAESESNQEATGAEVESEPSEASAPREE